jgi:hypothetical protein
MKQQISLLHQNFTDVNVKTETRILNGEQVLYITKKEKIYQYDENTYAKVNQLLFHNGIINVTMKSSLLPDAPDFARGFIGIVFRANQEDTSFESFYLRPANGTDCKDPERKAHGCQYFSYPGYTFQYFRDRGISEYEAPASIRLNEWFQLTAVVENDHAAFYINQESSPVLEVPHLLHGNGKPGSVGIYVDIGTEAWISSLSITCDDT